MNNKYKLVALLGPAGSGKDYILWHIMKTIWGKTHLHRLIPSTTRPPRKNEKDGVQYHFLPTSTTFFDWNNLNKWVDFTSFNSWWYGTSIDEFQKDKINIGIFNPKGLDIIINQRNEEIDCLPIYVKATDRVRLLRQLKREDEPDCEEIARRFLSDKKDFLNLNFFYKMIENNTDEVQPIINELIPIITHWSIKEK